MGKITDADVQKLAELSKLAMNQEELTKIKQELEGILQFIDKLQQIETEGVEPTTQVTGLTNVSRDDKVKDYGVSTKEMLKNAPEQLDGYLKVPKVL